MSIMRVPTQERYLWSFFIGTLFISLYGCSVQQESLRSDQQLLQTTREVVFHITALDPVNSPAFQSLVNDIDESNGEITEVLPNQDLVVRYATSEEASTVVTRYSEKNAAISDEDGTIDVVASKRTAKKEARNKTKNPEDSDYSGPFRQLTTKEALPDLRNLVKPLSTQELKNLGTNFIKEALKVKRSRSFSSQLPPRIDLSESEFFPGIGNQGPLGSCVVWANSYYTLSFEYLKSAGIRASHQNWSDALTDLPWKNKYNLEASDAGNTAACSPAYIYTLASGGVDQGVELLNTQYIQKHLGCSGLGQIPTWKNVDSSGHFNPSYFPTIRDQFEGMKRRIQGVRYFASLNATENKSIVPSPSEDIVQQIKSVLNAGHWVGGLVVLVYDDFDYYFGKRPCDQDGVYIFGRCLNQPINPKPSSISLVKSPKFEKLKFQTYHGVSIAGYDDNKEYTDLQGQKKKGAFKVTNSWGSQWGDHGFFWVPYDEVAKGRRPEGDLDQFRDQGYEWPKDQTGFPDKNHSVVSGALYFITGIEKTFVKNAIEVKFIQNSDDYVAYQIQVGSKSKIFGPSDDLSWISDGKISDTTSINSDAVPRKPARLGLRVVKNQEVSLVHDITDLLVDAEFPLEIKVTPIAVTAGSEPGTKIVGASLRRRTRTGFISDSLSLAQGLGQPTSFVIRLQNDQELPQPPKTGSFCAPWGNVILFYCGGDGQPDSSWKADPGTRGCYQREAGLKCDASQYGQCKTNFIKNNDQLVLRACGCNPTVIDTTDSEWNQTKTKKCYIHKTTAPRF